MFIDKIDNVLAVTQYHKPLYINILKYTLAVLMLLLGVVCRAQYGNEHEILEKLQKQAKEYTENGEPIKLAQTFHKMGKTYSQIREYNKAIDVYKKSATLYLQNKRLANVQKLYSNIGLMYTELDEYENALTYMKMALKTARLRNNDTAISGCITDVAYILIIEKEYRVAIDQLLDALKLAQDINHKQLIIKCYQMLMECYRALGMHAKFMEYQTKLNNMTSHVNQELANQEVQELKRDRYVTNERHKLEDSIQRLLFEQERINAENAEKLSANNLKNKIITENTMNLDQQRKLFQLEKQRDQQLQKEKNDAQSKREQLLQYIYIGASLLLLFLLIAYLAWRNARKTKQLNTLLRENNMIMEEQNMQVEKWANELAETNKQISIQQQAIADSIAYAKHIQMSMLISKDLLRKAIPQLAIFFKPRNVVSGDFYWYHRKGIKTYLAAIDCTGHGVPGAMISMIGYNILENIMNGTKLEHPNDIMDKMHMEIRNTLRQDTTDNHDGMDMSLVMIDSTNRKLEYCGAKNALVVARPGKEPEKIKPNPFGIGGLVPDDPENPNPTGERKFTNVDVPVDDEATYYIFSDGYSDQFGGQENKKYMLGRFRKMLGSICHLPMNEQEQQLKEEFRIWKGDNEQTDDILVIGFRV